MRVFTEKDRLTLSDASSSSWLLAGAIVLVGLFFTFNGVAVYLGFIVGHIDSANLMLLLGTTLLALGLWLVHTSPNLQTVFEPSRSRVLISKKRLFFSSPPQEIHFQELSRLEIASDQEVPEPGTSHHYALRLVTIGGQRVLLCNNSHRKQSDFDEALSKTRSFLRGYGLMI